MINKLYKAKVGTLHIVRVIGKYREMLRGEKLDNTACTYQVLAQRQWVLPKSISGFDIIYENDEDFQPFTMEEELFVENYEVLDETQTNT